MPIPVLSESVLIAAAKTGWSFFSTLWDLISNRRKTKAYDENKKLAYRELLKGDACDWSFVESVIAQSVAKGDLTPDAFRLKSLHQNAKAHVAKKPVVKRKVAKKPVARKTGRKPSVKTAPKKPAAKKK